MKYIKLFEELDDLKIGDYIVLLHPDKEDLDHGFREGEIYEIITRNDGIKYNHHPDIEYMGKIELDEHEANLIETEDKYNL